MQGTVFGHCLQIDLINIAHAYTVADAPVPLCLEAPCSALLPSSRDLLPCHSSSTDCRRAAFRSRAARTCERAEQAPESSLCQNCTTSESELRPGREPQVQAAHRLLHLELGSCVSSDTPSVVVAPVGLAACVFGTSTAPPRTKPRCCTNPHVLNSW